MIEIKIDDRNLKKYIDDLARRALDMKPLMRQIAGIMHDAVEENFEKEGRPKWPSLAKRTIEQRVKKGYWPGMILQMRGQLAASISSRYDANSARVGTNLAYAAIHQFGGKAGRGKKVEIPARPFLKLTEEDMENIKKAVVKYLKS